MNPGEKITLSRPFKYRENYDGVTYEEIVPAGTVCEYVTQRKSDRFIPEWRLKGKYFDADWDVKANEGLTIPRGHVIKIPLDQCHSSTLITVNKDFLSKYFEEVSE